MSDDQVAKLARAMVIVLGLISLYLAIVSSSTLASLLLMGYAGVSQFFPGVVLGLYWRRVTMSGVFCGMVAGIGTDIFLMLTHRDPFFGINAGFLALCLNFALVGGVSVLTAEPGGRLESQQPASRRARRSARHYLSHLPTCRRGRRWCACHARRRPGSAGPESQTRTPGVSAQARFSDSARPRGGDRTSGLRDGYSGHSDRRGHNDTDHDRRRCNRTCRRLTAQAGHSGQ
jgi:hypothetical protein